MAPTKTAESSMFNLTPLRAPEIRAQSHGLDRSIMIDTGSCDLATPFPSGKVSSKLSSAELS